MFIILSKVWLLGFNFPSDLNDISLVLYIPKYKTWHNINSHHTTLNHICIIKQWIFLCFIGILWLILPLLLLFIHCHIYIYIYIIGTFQLLELDNYIIKLKVLEPNSNNVFTNWPKYINFTHAICILVV